MCLESRIHFHDCACIFIRNLVCNDHVDHTHKQIDNNPCPKFEVRHVELQSGGCFDKPNAGGACKKTKDEVWVFEKWDKSKSRVFVEPGRPLIHGCLRGSFMTKGHTCEIGLGWDTPWRHLDADGKPFGEAATAVSKEDVNKDTDEDDKMEEVKMEGVKNEDVEML